MTTLAAVFGALPLAIGFGEGAELRHPLGIAIIGGLIASQVLTLLTTPVVYLALDRFRRSGREANGRRGCIRSSHEAPALPLTACWPSLHRRPQLPPPDRRDAAGVQGGAAEAGWVSAAPADALDKGPWWTLFGDPVLNDLCARIEVDNQNVAAAAAAYEQARALVREARAGYFPTLDITPAVTRSGGGGSAGTIITSGGTVTGGTTGTGTRAPAATPAPARPAARRSARPAAARATASPAARAGSPTCGAASAASVEQAKGTARRPPPTSPPRGCRRRANSRPTSSRFAPSTPRSR